MCLSFGIAGGGFKVSSKRSFRGLNGEREVISGRRKSVFMATSVSTSKVPPWFGSFAGSAAAGMLFGYDIGSTSSALRVLGENGYSATQLASVASVTLFGALASSLVVLQLGNFFGRKTELKTAFGLYLTGTVLQSFAPSYPILMFARIIYGLGIGVAMHAAPMIISESAPSNRRGSLVALKEAFIVGGILTGYISGAAFAPLGPESWRLMFGAALAVEIPGLILANTIPESPRWLCLKAISAEEEYEGYIQRAEECQALLSGGDTQKAKGDVQDMLQTLEGDNESSEDFKLGELLNVPGAKASLVAGVGLVLLQQLTGQPSVLYYANRIFEDAGLGYSAAVGVGLFKLVITIAAASLVEKVGRRPLLLSGTAIMTVCLAVLSYIFAGTDPNTALTTQQQLGIVGAVILYVGGYQVGFGPIAWLILSEIFPLRVRSSALAVGTVANFGSNLAVAALFEPLRQSVGSAVLFSGFTLISIAAIAFEYTSVPETKGKTLEEIETIMRSREL